MSILTSSSRMQLSVLLVGLGVGYNDRQLMAGRKLKPWEIFLLKRLILNLKGSQVVKLFEAMDQEETTTSQRGDNSDESMDLVNKKSRMEI